jgi:hypothetical protein
MTGGSLNQAKCRSTDAVSSTSDGTNMVLTLGDGTMISCEAPEPNQEELLAEIAKRHTCNLTIPPQKTKRLIEPAEEEQKTLIDIAKQQTSDAIANKIAAAIPAEIPKTVMNGDKLSKRVFEINTALKAYVDASKRLHGQF